MTHTTRFFSGLLLVLCGVIFTPRPATSREKSDVVILKNGDHITWEIKTLARGMLTVKTDSMGTVDIKWQDVEKVTSKFLFTVQDTQGTIYVGSLQPGPENRHVNISGAPDAGNLDHLSIVQIQELEGNLWKRFSGSVDLSYAFTKASDRTQFNFAGDTTYRTERYSAQLKYSSTLGTSNGTTDADRKVVNLIGTRQFAGKWMAYAQASFEHNLELQLDRRFSFLGGPGYEIQRSNRSMLTAIAAASFSRESYFQQDVTKNAEGFFGLDAQFFKLYSPKVDIVNQFVFLPNFTTRGRRRMELNTKLRLEVLKDFFVTLTFYDSYDSKPPARQASTNDYGFTTGISWSFRR
jgi:hypothetical protein